MDMILNPMRSAEQSIRYPDETIVPTGVVSLQDSVSYQVGSIVGGVAGTVQATLRWKVVNDDPASALNELPIVSPKPLGTLGGNVPYAQQAQWLPLSAVDRTLACGIRLRVVGLPPAAFMPSGTVYFLQYQNSEYTDLLASLSGLAGESAARAAVAAKKGFSCTVNEVSKTDGVLLPYLPQGPMSFVFSDTGSAVATGAGMAGGAPSTVVSANGGVLIVGFGLQDGMELRFDFGHIIEYIPRAVAAGLVATAVQPPSAVLRDGISTGAAMIQQHLGGATTLSSIARVVVGGASAAAAAVARGVVASTPGAPLIARGLSAAAESLGAPAWLRSALATLT